MLMSYLIKAHWSEYGLVDSVMPSVLSFNRGIYVLYNFCKD